MRLNARGTFNGATSKLFPLLAALPPSSRVGRLRAARQGARRKPADAPSRRTGAGGFRPGLYCVLNDKSASAKSARIAPLTEGDLLVLIELLRLTGCALAYGEIGESRDRPLVRLRVAAPPVPPRKPDYSDAFERAEQEGRYEEQAATHKAEYER